MSNSTFKKYLTATITLLIISMSILPPVTGELTKRNLGRDVVLRIINIDENGRFFKKDISMNNTQFNSLIKSLSDLLNGVLIHGNYSEIILSLLKLTKFEERKPFFSDILEYVLKKHPSLVEETKIKSLRPLKSTFVISQGWGYNLNFFRDSSYKIMMKPLTLWRYYDSSKAGTTSLTYISRPENTRASETTILLKGHQMGLMLRFTGIYIYEANTFPKQSYTFFIGFAQYVKGCAEYEYGVDIPH